MQSGFSEKYLWKSTDEYQELPTWGWEDAEIVSLPKLKTGAKYTQIS